MLLQTRPGISRRSFLGGTVASLSWPFLAEAGQDDSLDVTFVFTSDVHACLMHDGLGPSCQAAGKTDDNLRTHIHAINGIGAHAWPAFIGSRPTTIAVAGEKIGRPRGVVIAGDLTDDGGGQGAIPGEGMQLQQFSHRYREGPGPDQIHFPVYIGLGNHDLDQDGPIEQRDWYRREMRDYVEMNHRPSVFYKPALPAADYDLYSDNYSWDWDGLHLIQAQRFAGDTRKGAIDSLPWLRRNLETYAADGRPVILFQHYGWDSFSTSVWDPAYRRFAATGTGPARWWSAEERDRLTAVLDGFNVIGIFHGHQHDEALIYKAQGRDIFSAKAAFLGGFAVMRVTKSAMNVVFAEARANGSVRFTHAFSKPISTRRRA